MSLDKLLEDYFFPEDVGRNDSNDEYIQAAKQTILKDLLDIIEQSRIETEWRIDGNVAIHKTGFITEQELREAVRKYCE